MNDTAKLFEIMRLGPVWKLRQGEPDESQVQQDNPEPVWQSLDELKECVRLCQKCGLCESRTQTVFADGVPGSDLMVIGEAPGADEDRIGKPFVGRAGQLLERMLTSIGRSRANNVFIANVLKCRPPNNRDPQANEVDQCLPYLHAQIGLVQPRVIFLVGKQAASALLGLKGSIESVRGKAHDLTIQGQSFKAVVGYHPAYLLRNPVAKAKSWDDLLLLNKLLGEP